MALTKHENNADITQINTKITPNTQNLSEVWLETSPDIKRNVKFTF